MAGANQLNGNGGNDSLAIANTANPNGSGGFLLPTTYSGAGSTLDGGTGTDILRLRNFDGGPPSVSGPVSLHNLINGAPASFTGIEQIDFDSDAGTALQGVLQFAQFAGSGLTQLSGGDGADAFILVVTTAGTFATPNLTLLNWGSNDAIVLTVGGNISGVTLNALEGLGSLQVLLGGGVADTINGSTAYDFIRGNAGNDIINGGGGLDLIYGGLGDDLYTVTTQAALLFENAGEGTDTVSSSISYYLYENIENLTLTGAAGNFGVGNELANTLTGNSGENLLIAGAGDDEVHSGAARDAIFGQDGADRLYGDGGLDYIVAGSGNDTIAGGADFDEIYGQDGDDTILGGTNFTFDKLIGGDVLFGEAGNDIFVFTAGTGGDVIGDFTAGQDKIDLSAFGLSFVQAQANFSQVGGDGAINLGNGDFIVLNGVTMSTLTAADFILGAAAQAAPKGGAPVMELAGDWSDAPTAAYTSDNMLFSDRSLMPLHGEAFI